MNRSDTSRAMERALDMARDAAACGEVPVGAAVIGPDGRIVACAGNRVEAERDVSAHAELLAMREAARVLGSTRLVGCTLVVTLEPCPMCAAAIVHFRPDRVVFGAYDPKGGGVEHGPRIFGQRACLHRPEVVGGVCEREAGALLSGFFSALRARPAAGSVGEAGEETGGESGGGDDCVTDVSRGRQLAERRGRP